MERFIFALLNVLIVLRAQECEHVKPPAHCSRSVGLHEMPFGAGIQLTPMLHSEASVVWLLQRISNNSSRAFPQRKQQTQHQPRPLDLFLCR